MARMLGRSRSLRMLKAGRKEADQREMDSTTPLPTHSQVEVNRLKAATPVSKPDGGVETFDMLQRPKTSGGPGDRSTQFHKKVTPVYQTDNQEFTFPFTSPTKSTTVLYTAEVYEEREGIIGIALGSPTMATHSSNWHASPRPTDFVTDSQGTITYISSNGHSPSPNPYSQTSENPQGAAKPKLSRWKSLFKKTAPPRPVQDKETFYQLARSVPPARADSHHDDESIESRSLAQTDDSPKAASPPSYTFNPQIRESRKLPKGKGQPDKDTRPRALTQGVTSPVNKTKSSLLRSVSSPKVPPKDDYKSSPLPQLVVSGSSSRSSPGATGATPLLDVDIPTVHMERYSVMFSNLLQQNSSSSALLQRRQGNSEKLKPLNPLSTKTESDGSLEPLKPPRRATSPIPSSARLSLFPSANTSRAPSPRNVAHRPRPLQRSKTAPATSPHRQSFPKQPEDGANTPSQEIKNALSETASPALTPRSHASTSGGVESPLGSLYPPRTPSELSFDSDSEEITVAVARDGPAKAWKARIEDLSPQWEIVSKPTLNPHAVTKASALRSHPSTRQPSSAPLDTPSASRSPGLSRSKSQTLLSPKPQTMSGSQATVGVARSVSVSRANKPASLLKPGFLSPGSGGRFVEGKPLTPTLVELSNRKSQRVQLVDA
ncbi:hypothetical protein K458DRAFT_401732 [Lentithecium fluviatile CBS 122367]|uniref:Uncharacterized protein n=1 Tax=Lentithecium fluviatile CBS 122367 TaxID=1168545 RepID=A0A6G1J9F2_9PLEO|nr:hypothetical protein K458DRAFT_401732 [Lentithecium fluviatile CBS 122367]